MKKIGIKIYSVFLSLFVISLIFTPQVAYGIETLKQSSVKVTLGNLKEGNTLEEGYIDGTIESINDLTSVSILINDSKLGDLNLRDKKAIEREGKNLYITNFKYKFDISNFYSGQYNLKFMMKDDKGNTSEDIKAIKIKGKEPMENDSIKVVKKNSRTLNYLQSPSSKTPIMGKAEATKGQAVTYLKNGNPNKSEDYIVYFVNCTWEEAEYEGIRPDVAFVQMMKETGYLKFGGDVEASQNNFAGIGAVGGGVKGESFPDIKTGIRAVVQHLKAYASKEPLKNEQVDPRYNLVEKGISPYVEGLSGKWASDLGYGEGIVKSISYVKTLQEFIQKATINYFKVYDGTNEVKGNNYKYGKTYTLKASANADTKALYQFWLKDLRTNSWALLKDYTENPNFNWTAPTSGEKYLLGIHVKDKNSLDRLDNFKYDEISLSHGKAKINSMKIYDGASEIKDNRYMAGKVYTIKGSANADTNALYQFWQKDLRTNSWKMLRDYSESDTFNWTVPMDGEKYYIGIHVKDKSSPNKLDDNKYDSIVVSHGKVKITGMKIYDGANEIKDNRYMAGKVYTIKGFANADTNALYQFWQKDLRTNSWKMLRDYGESNTFNWTVPVDGEKYYIGIHVKDKSSLNKLDDNKYDSIILSRGKAKITGMKIYDGANEIKDNRYMAGKVYTIKGSANADTKALYQFWQKDLRTNSWKMLRDYSESDTFNWTVPVDGEKYYIGIHVKDKSSLNKLDDNKYDSIILSRGKAKITGMKIYDGANEIKDNMYKAGKVYTIKGSANADTNALYQFWQKDLRTNSWKMLRDYSESDTFNWTVPADSEKYYIGIHVKDKSSLNKLDDNKYDSITVSYGKAKIVSMKVYDGSTEIKDKNFRGGNLYTVKASASADSKVLYQFWEKDLKTNSWKMLRDYSESNTYNWIAPKKGGNYYIGIHVKDKYSPNKLDDNKYDSITVEGVIERKLIVLDAGHGGKDPGASAAGLVEAEINQNLTLKLGNKLKSMGYDVIYTRDYIPANYKSVGEDLEARISVANSRKADLFISIHHDAFPGGEGTSTHHSTHMPRLDTSGIVSIGGITYDRTPCNEAIKSRELAKLIAKRLGNVGFKDRGSQDHNLYVTKNAIMPSVLVECGFIDNPSDRAKFMNPSIQNKMVDAIASSIADLF
ncbi:N-acetylmuramoyl-L-alanine amidase [Hathewaya histolytica]|uniref:N-acetylmuramoyl-L-alanine amidase n=1 Tax=Hathewaya histolytica TaxID=1498 RepID=UPI003B677207